MKLEKAARNVAATHCCEGGWGSKWSKESDVLSLRRRVCELFVGGWLERGWELLTGRVSLAGSSQAKVPRVPEMQPRTYRGRHF